MAISREEADKITHETIHDPMASASAMLALIKLMRESGREELTVNIDEEAEHLWGLQFHLNSDERSFTFKRVPHPDWEE